MNKSVLYSMLLAVIFAACDPVESRGPIGDPITAEQLEITATPIVVNGKNSNRIVLENHSPVLSSWDYGLGTTQKQTDTVLMVLTGESKIIFTGLNPDGSEITKELTVNVDELSFSVPEEWALFCGDGVKVWVWDDTQPLTDNGSPAVFGNGGYKGSKGPDWWKCGITEMDGQVAGEGEGASMTFSVAGSKLTKHLSDGSKVEGTFTFDMSKVTLDDGGAVWAKGKLTTKNVNVLCGISPNEGKAVVYEYDILLLNDGHIALSYPEPGVGSWGTAFFWMFKAK